MRGRVSWSKVVTTIVGVAAVFACMYVRALVHPARQPGSSTVVIRCDAGPDGLRAAVLRSNPADATDAVVDVGLYVQAAPKRQKAEILYRTDQVRLQVHGVSDAAAKLRDTQPLDAWQELIGRAIAEHLHDDVWVSAARSEGAWITGRYLSDLFFSPLVLLVLFAVGAVVYISWQFRVSKKLLKQLEAEMEAAERSAGHRL